MSNQQTWPPWSPKLGWLDEHDYMSRDAREWGIDVPLPAGTAVFAPEASTVIAYQPSTADWPPGRLILRLDRGGLIGFGHVDVVVQPTTHVEGGQQIAAIGDQGDNSHVEFMYSEIDHGPHTPRQYFVAYPLNDPRSPWALLVGYMTLEVIMLVEEIAKVLFPGGIDDALQCIDRLLLNGITGRRENSVQHIQSVIDEIKAKGLAKYLAEFNDTAEFLDSSTPALVKKMANQLNVPRGAPGDPYKME